MDLPRIWRVLGCPKIKFSVVLILRELPGLTKRDTFGGLGSPSRKKGSQSRPGKCPKLFFFLTKYKISERQNRRMYWAVRKFAKTLMFGKRQFPLFPFSVKSTKVEGCIGRFASKQKALRWELRRIHDRKTATQSLFREPFFNNFAKNWKKNTSRNSVCNRIAF